MRSPHGHTRARTHGSAYRDSSQLAQLLSHQCCEHTSHSKITQDELLSFSMTYPCTPRARLSPVVIDTNMHRAQVFQFEHEEETRLARPRYRQSPLQRARSHSPARRSPKLRHTYGRLHLGPDEETIKVHTTDFGSKDDDELLFWLIPQPPRMMHTGRNSRMTRQRQSTQSFPSRASAALIEFPARDNVRRSISCAEYGQPDPILRGSDDDATVSQRAPRRFTIFYRDETLRENCDKNTRRMIESAKQTQQHTKESRASTCGSNAVVLSNQQRLALKALKYRNLLDRMHAIDDDRLKDPSFDVLECLGVQWCKV